MRKINNFHVFKLYLAKVKIMECAFNSYRINQYPFMKKQKKDNSNAGVIVPPDKLPTANVYDIIQKTEKQKPEAVKSKGGRKLTAGRLSAILAFWAMALSLVSLLPFIRKH